MLCQRCHQHEARVEVVVDTQNGRETRYLCPTCALTLPTFFAPARPAPTRRLVCPRCGLRLSEFAEGKKLGCPTCYDTFALDLADVLTRVQGTDRHVDDLETCADNNDGEAMSREAALRCALAEAVAREDYDEAAKLRDALHACAQEACSQDEGHDDGRSD